MMNLRLTYLLIAVVAVTTTASESNAQDQNNFYVTVDGRNPLTFGTYTGLENPNVGRLTLLYAHWNQETPENNHFHSIGSYNYEGPIESPTVTATNTNNRIPEGYTGQAPLTLQEGSGELAGKLISAHTDEHYSDLTFYPIHDLSPAAEGTPEGIMYASSGGGYASTAMDGMNLAIELVSMTPGLYLGTEQLSSPGDQITIGSEADLPFTPLFWTNDDVAPGHYEAEFKLVDLSGTYPDSGTINFDFAVVPEPGSGSLVLLGASVIGMIARRQNR